MSDVEIFMAQDASAYSTARELFVEYASWLGIDLGFQGFSRELELLPEMYGPPSGCLLLCRYAGALVACVGLRRVSADTCEMKRLFVRASYRGHGLGRRLTLEAVEAAKHLGYTRMLLDTFDSMAAARQIYVSLGFEETSAYYANPLPGVRYMALDLRSAKVADE